MPEVSLFRLYLMRAAYAFTFVGIAINIWPDVVNHKPDTQLFDGVVTSILSTVGILAAIGLRYPLKMLPLMLFELIWKSTWLLAYALPLWRAGQMDPSTQASVYACLVGVIFPIVIPWPYVWKKYIREPGDRWLRTPA
ncbi:MAG: hypothetical protein ACHQAU_01340 [Gammaproteobacteria bacterium]